MPRDSLTNRDQSSGDQAPPGLPGDAAPWHPSIRDPGGDLYADRARIASAEHLDELRLAAGLNWGKAGRMPGRMGG